MPRMNDRSTLEGGGVNGAARVLVIGGDHANTLASVRALSRHGIAFDLILHGVRPGQRTMVGASRHAPEPLFAEGTYEAINDAVESWMGKSDPSRCILLPSSDLAALVIDERFRPRGVRVSGFEGDRWRISDLMDKYAQAQWAAERDIPVAKGVEVDPKHSCANCPVELPVIVKPSVSAEGEKSDITICQSTQEYVTAKKKFADLGYKRMLVQELVSYEYEITCICAILLDGTPVWRAYAKDVVHPEGRGSTVYAHLEQDRVVLEAISSVLSTLADEGYRGLCDMDFFKTGDRVILNEVNFRQSGIVAFSFAEGLYLPSLWAKGLAGTLGEGDAEFPKRSYYAIAEDGYLYYVKESGKGIGEWLSALRKADGKTLLFPGDNGPFWAFIRNTLANQVRRAAGMTDRGAKR